MPNRRVGLAIIDVLTRLPQRFGHRITLDNLPAALRDLRGGERLLKFNKLLTKNAEDLNVYDFRELVAAIHNFVRSQIEELPNEVSKQVVRRFATVRNVVLILNDQSTLKRLARIEPIRVPRSLDDAYARPEQLVRSGHPANSPHREIPISADLYGSKLVSYFYISGKDFPKAKEITKVPYSLVAHDSDEFVYFFGASDSAAPASLPIYMEGELDPYEHVRKPFRISRGYWTIYDGNAPHFWFAPRESVAFFVSAAPTGTYGKAIGFRQHHSDDTPGAQYRLFDKGNENLEAPRTHLIFGKRLRRSRDILQLPARKVEELKAGRGITSNIVGKIENSAIENLHVRVVAEFAEAMDVPLESLFAWNPQYERLDSANVDVARPFLPEKTQDASNDNPVDLSLMLRDEPFAVSAHRIRFSTWNGSLDHSARLQFWQGEADIALLPVKGRLRVYVAPNPLLLALEIAEESSSREIQPIAFPDGRERRACFALSSATINRLVGRGLLHFDIIESDHAYHFNAMLPHAIISDDGVDTSTALAVTTSADRRLPRRWILR